MNSTATREDFMDMDHFLRLRNNLDIQTTTSAIGKAVPWSRGVHKSESLSIEPSILDFGHLQIGKVYEMHLKLKNNGDQIIKFSLSKPESFFMAFDASSYKVLFALSVIMIDISWVVSNGKSLSGSFG